MGALDLLVLQNNQKLNFEGSRNLQSFLNISGTGDSCREYISVLQSCVYFPAYIGNDYFHFSYFDGAFASLLSTVLFIRLFPCCIGRMVAFSLLAEGGTYMA